MTPKERNLLKGAVRRVFSRSEVRRAALHIVHIPGYKDPNRTRVTKWSRCPNCLQPTPTYIMQVDHIDPLIPVDTALEDMTWDDVFNRTWCDKNNLMPMCKPCHKIKSKIEQKERALFRKQRKAA